MKRIYQENLLQGILNNSMDAFIVTDASQVVVEWNPNSIKLFGWSKEEAIGRSLNDLIIPEGFKKFHQVEHTGDPEQYLDRVKHPILNRRVNLPAVCKDGSKLMIEVTITPVSVDDKLFFLAAVRDITDKHKVDQELERRANLINLSRDAIYVLNEDHELTLWNQGATDLYGYTVEDALGKSSYKLLKTVYEGDQFMRIVGHLMKYGRWEGELTQYRKDGTNVVVLSRWALDKDKREVLVTNTDITELKTNQDRALYLATHDELTCLPNRRLVEDRLQHAISTASRHGTQFAVMVMDLDRFKLINDSMGHDQGDLLLQQVGSRLRGIMRDEDTVGRLGGDEFMVIIENLESNTIAGEIAAKIGKATSMPLTLQGREMVINTSIGIAIYPSNGLDAKTLVSNADMAMYGAKRNDGACYFFYSSEMNDEVQHRLTYENELRKAVELKQFFLQYQAKVSHTENKTMGVEALIRWNHPIKGMVSPLDFIPVAEETGLIGAIGEWALREACRQNKEWQDQGMSPIVMSVNISLHQLGHDIVGTVKRILSETGLDPQWLDLEITESAAMKNVDKTIETLKEIRSLGVRLSMDDFGTGYSSLEHLMRMPLDYLKIDQSFINGMLRDPYYIAVVNTIIKLAKTIGLKVVAEGVTDVEQVAILDTMQCEEMQGFLFTKPMGPKFIKDEVINKHWDDDAEVQKLA